MNPRDELLHELAAAEARLVELTAQHQQAQALVDNLRRQSGAAAPLATRPPASLPESGPSPAEKIRLFRSLFRGRGDVFPRLWINTKKNAKGYSPVCGNEWVRGVCEKPRVKCGECRHQAFLAIDDDVVLGHLQGRHVIGVYPMLEDETCWFLAADFDKAQWMQDVAAFVSTCTEFDIPAAVERSRSGNGAHVWIFFASPVPAAVARTMGCYLLTETMARRHELPLSSYDRFGSSGIRVGRPRSRGLIACCGVESEVLGWGRQWRVALPTVACAHMKLAARLCSPSPLVGASA